MWKKGEKIMTINLPKLLRSNELKLLYRDFHSKGKITTLLKEKEIINT